MTWIRIIPPESASPELRETYEKLKALYPPEYGPPVEALVRPDGTKDSIIAAHSLLPDAMWHMMAGLAMLLRPGLPLGRREQEMIAAVVSARNSCFY
jgi:hypothetical protein